MGEQVTLSEVQVMYVESDNGIAGASEAFDRLEARFPSLKGRKFYGTFQRDRIARALPSKRKTMSQH